MKPAPSLALAILPIAFGCSRTPSPLTPNVVGITIGAPAKGVLQRGAQLPASGQGFRWLRPFGHHYGLPRFVSAVQDAAEAVHRERPGAPVMIGDMSARTGGQIPGHRSHRTGRDVDILFYVTTPEGAPLANTGFYQFGPDGLAMMPAGHGGPRYVRFDVEREWLLVKALVSSPEANVQWIFVSRPLEALLVEYARARGEAPELVWRAETVMLQPGDSLPHDDHIHVRTACLPDEMLAGCEGGGPYWDWLPKLAALPEEPDEMLVAALVEPIPTGGTAVAGASAASEPSNASGGGRAAPSAITR